MEEIQITSLYCQHCLFQEGEKWSLNALSCVLVRKEQSKVNKKEAGGVVQEEERQSLPNSRKCNLTGDSKKPMKGSTPVSTKKRKMVEMLEKKKRKKKI